MEHNVSETLKAPVLPDEAPPSPNPPRRAWRPWRSPDHEPPWARPALLALTAATAVIYSWGIGGSQLHSYYAPAVKSMSESWKAFFYGGYDPSASITVDKLSGPFMLQALFVRALGFHPWVVVLPQVLASIVTVLVLYRIVRMWQGPVAGILAATLFALTPLVGAVARSQISDVLLVALLVLAAESAQRAA